MGKNINKIFKISLLLFILLIAIAMVSASDMDSIDESNTDFSLSNENLNAIDDEFNENDLEISDSNNDLKESDSDTEDIKENSLSASPNTIEISHTDDDLSDIQTAINGASSGDTILLGDYTYNIGAGQINVTKNITLKGNGNSTIINGSGGGGKSGCDMNVQTRGATIDGLRFNNFAANLTYSDWDTLEGWAIRLDYSSKILVNNCAFINYNRAVNFATTSDSVVSNSYFTGVATRVTGGDGKERGTRAISTQDNSNNNIIVNNTFDGPMLDGINLDAAKNTKIIGNTFINNAYAIYFDKSATDGALIANNTFNECGHFEASLDGVPINFQNLPMIYARESFSNFTITENDFIARNENVLIYCHSTNDIGNVDITKNSVALVNDGVDPSTISFMKIPTRESLLGLIGDIKLIDNGLISPMVYLELSDENRIYNGSDIIIRGPRDQSNLIINVDSKVLSDNVLFKFNLTGMEGGRVVPLNETISVSFNNQDYDVKTVNGIGELKINETLELGFYEIKASFLGNDDFDASNDTKTFELIEYPQTVIEYQDMTTTAVDTATDGRIGKYFVVTLKDGKGNALANKFIQIGFNGNVYNRTTDDNGQAKLQINLKAAGTYTFAVAFLGGLDYNGSFIVAKIVVNKQKGSLTVPNKSYKASATKTLTATFKAASGKVVKGKKVTFTVNGKTYTATTNDKGVASVKVSISKKGTYSFTAKFAGDNTYAAMSKTAKLTIK